MSTTQPNMWGPGTFVAGTDVADLDNDGDSDVFVVNSYRRRRAFPSCELPGTVGVDPVRLDPLLADVSRCLTRSPEPDS